MGRTVGAAIGALFMMIVFATIAARIHHTYSSSSPGPAATMSKR